MRTNQSAYVKDGRLIIIGVTESPIGVIPFSYHAKLSGDVPDGPVSMERAEHPAVQQALVGAEGPIAQKINNDTLKLAAENLVERSRQGDQNATGMIVMIRKSVKKGSAKASAAFKAVQDYIKEHPIGPMKLVSIHGEQKESTSQALVKRTAQATDSVQYAAQIAAYVPAIGADIDACYLASVILANGREISKADVENIASTYAKEAKQNFWYGFKRALFSNEILVRASKIDDESRKAMQVGYTISLAQRLQYIRRPNTPIAAYSLEAAWELGEKV